MTSFVLYYILLLTFHSGTAIRFGRYASARRYPSGIVQFLQLRIIPTDNFGACHFHKSNILRRNALYVREIIYALCVGDLPQ